jgi:hypothetical protein
MILAGLGIAMAMPAGAGESADERARKAEARQAAMDEVSKVIDSYLLTHVQDALALSDEKATKIVPLIVTYQAGRRNHFERRNRLVGEMRKALESGGATEARIGEMMKEMRTLETDEAAKLRKALEAIDQELTVVQQAKFRLLEQDVHRRMGELRDKARRKQRAEEERGRRDRPRDKKPDEPRPNP